MFGRKHINMRQNIDDTQRAELELITDELIEETKEKMRKQFENSLKHRRDAVIEEREIQEIINGLLKTAITQRNNLLTRIEKDVEAGGLFNRYYGKMEIINRLTNITYIKLQQFKAARNRYQFEREVYERVVHEKYTEKFTPRKKDSILSRKGDIWEEIEEGERELGLQFEPKKNENDEQEKDS